MSNDRTKYVQCVLHKDKEGKLLKQVTYVPEKFSEIGTVLRLRNEDMSWDNGWVVTSTGAIVDDPPDVRKGIRNHRKRTGDSLRK